MAMHLRSAAAMCCVAHATLHVCEPTPIDVLSWHAQCLWRSTFLFVYSLSGLLPTAQLFCSAVLSELMARDFEALELCRLVTVACTICTTCQDTALALLAGHLHGLLVSAINSCHLKDLCKLYAAPFVEAQAVLDQSLRYHIKAS